jgi:hypothetical protein
LYGVLNFNRKIKKKANNRLSMRMGKRVAESFRRQTGIKLNKQI